MNRYQSARAAFNAQTRRRIRILMAVENVTARKLAKRSGLSCSCLNNTMNHPTQQPKLARVAKIAEVLRFDLGVLLGRKSLFARKLGKRVVAVA